MTSKLAKLGLVSVTTAGFALSAGTNAWANIAYDNAANVGGLQNFGGVLGLDFTVNTPISVTALGVFDNGLNANLGGSDGTSGVTVGFYDVGSQTLIGPSVHFAPADGGITQVRGDAFKNIVPLTLLPGTTYSIVTFNDTNYNTGGGINGTVALDGSGAINFVGNGRYGSSTGSFMFPNIVDGGPQARYDAGTFQFTVAFPAAQADVPEPASITLMFGALGALGFARRRRA